MNPERPVSRSSALSSGGMAVPLGMASSVAAPPRPSSRGGAPPGTSAGAPPGTASRGGMIPPASRGNVRPPSGRAGVRPPTGSVGFSADVQVADRPVTQQGMSGMRTAGMGPGRQVQDKSYWLTELRHKKQELTQVLEEMEGEIETINKDSGTFTVLERKHETIIKEVKGLQGQLADFNIILDKVGTDTPPEEIQHQFKLLKQNNDMERKKVDQVFTERAAFEQRMKDVERQIVAHQKGMEEKLNELAPDKRQQYHDLQVENKGLMDEVSNMEQQYEQLCRAVNSAEDELSSNNIKQRALSLNEQIRGLHEKKMELEAEENKLQLSPEELREQMKQKIKSDNDEIAQAEQQIKDIQDAIRRHEGKLQGVNMDLSEQPANTADKYEQLLKQEKELGDFIDNFDDNKASALADIAAKRDSTVSLLEKISKRGVALQGNLPSQRRFREMQDELEYKKIQMENAQTTQTRLQQELDLRKSELDKINTLEDKIKMELSSLNTKIGTMSEELVTFSRLDVLKENAEEARKRLEVARTRLLRRREATKQQTQEKNTKFEAKRMQLQENELFISLEKLETKMRTYEQNIFQMQDYIKAKEKETDYKPRLQEITNLTEELNQEVQKFALL